LNLKLLCLKNHDSFDENKMDLLHDFFLWKPMKFNTGKRYACY